VRGSRINIFRLDIYIYIYKRVCHIVSKSKRKINQPFYRNMPRIMELNIASTATMKLN